MTQTTDQTTAQTTAQEEHEHEHVLHASQDFKPKRVICMPVDASIYSRNAIKWAIEKIISKDEDQVVLLNVRPFVAPELSLAVGMPYAPYTLPLETQQKMEAESKARAHALLVELAKEFQLKSIHVRAVALRGDPRDALEAKINSLMPTIVVLSNRGMGVIKRMFIGSTSQHLVHHCKVPVVVIPPSVASNAPASA